MHDIGFCRRVYYEKATGKLICFYMMVGYFVQRTVDEDFEQVAELAQYRDRRDEVGVLEWLYLDEDLELAFQEAAPVRVDLSVQPPQMVFCLHEEPLNKDRG